MTEVYEIRGGECRKIEWVGVINPVVAQLAGYAIAEITPQFPYSAYLVKRKTYNRF